ncbi:hypothetical protein BCF55_1817 [Hydrogenivirga caldilitoris]|uniref:Uncharacterized protein n=1 Tax=Hydrogenivirga caldilitoris TaxID=246264 RepID=A0A497XR98_9AQUI|nr:hypothetical protein [Hydrogenivirga caldilitoris]RLJ71515.1 hypothetical protein BCF55_1817 [Hydrogenivirga caldilitoris]
MDNPVVYGATKLFLNFEFLAFFTVLFCGEFTLQTLGRKIREHKDTYTLARLLFLLLLLTSFGLWIEGPVRDFLLISLAEPEHIVLYTRASIVLWTVLISLLEGYELKK